MISLVVPVLNDEEALRGLLDTLSQVKGQYELIIADGGSTDGPRSVAAASAQVRVSPPGRGIQCNAGAAEACGEILLFLHCDSRVEPDVLEKVERCVQAGASWGCLQLRFDDPHPLMGIGSWKSNLRVKWSGVAFGDQGIFMTKDLFSRIGGFPAQPLMEDYQLSLNLKRLGIPPVQADSVITTSARRFREGGRLRTGWRMHRLRHLYRRGTPPEVLLALYDKGWKA